MNNELVQWRIDDEEAEVQALDRIEELERLGYRRAWHRCENGWSIWKLVPPSVYSPDKNDEPLLGI